MNDSTHILFELINQELEGAAKAICNRIFSEYQEISFSSEQRRILQPLIRKELESLIQGILGLFDNVGGILPDNIEGYVICDAQTDTDIRDSNLDYADMWIEYLLRKITKKVEK